MRIFIKTHAGKTIRIESNPTDSIATIKANISSKSGLQANQQILYKTEEDAMLGTDPLDDNKTLEYYNINKDDTIYVKLMTIEEMNKLDYKFRSDEMQALYYERSSTRRAKELADIDDNIVVMRSTGK